MVRAKIEQRTTGGPFVLRQAFKLFDRDGSGDIDPDEFYGAMEWMGLQFTERQVSCLEYTPQAALRDPAWECGR